MFLCTIEQYFRGQGLEKCLVLLFLGKCFNVVAVNLL